MVWRLIFWKPSGSGKAATFIACNVAALGTVGLHYHVGLAYEFHIFLSIPVVTAAWFLGLRPALALAATTVGLWFGADWLLAHPPGALNPLLFNTAMRLLISVTAAWMVAELRILLDGYRDMAFLDPLTKLPNRRAFLESGRTAIELARRQNAPLTCVFIDLDRFKEVNDTLGHQAGDKLLRTVAEGIRGHIRASDVAGRLGGDEFALLLPNLQPDDAMGFTEKLRDSLLGLMRRNGWPVTFSVGAVSHADVTDDLRAILAEADALMYEVKKTGRNRILMRQR